MSTGYTPLGLYKQTAGTNTNLWGEPYLNNNFDRTNNLVGGYVVMAITGDYTPTTSNTSTVQGDYEARNALWKFTGALAANATITVPSTSMRWMVWNATNKVLTFTTGAGATVSVDAGDRTVIWTDGAGVYTINFGGYDLKTYITQAALSAAGSLPAVTGNAGKFVYTDGATSYWKALATSDVASFSATATQVRVGTTTAAALTPGDTYNALAEVALTDAATVVLDLSTGINFALTLTDAVGATRTLGAATNGKPGQCGYIRTVQGGTGSKQLNPASPFYKRDGGIPANSTTVGAEDYYFYQVISATKAIYSFARAPS